MKFQAPFERLKDYTTSPEVSLYKAIITQAIIDATNTSILPQPKTLEKEAKNWIFGKSEYFQRICYLAGIEPDFVVKITQEAIRLNHRKFKLNKNKHDELQKRHIVKKSNAKRCKTEKIQAKF